MSETEKSPPKIVSQSMAVGLGGLMVLGFLLATAYAVYDRAQRHSVERIDYPSGVGDKVFFPPSFNPAQPLLNYDGHSFYFVEKDDILDTVVSRIGMDDSKAYSIYKLPVANGDAAFIYIKVAPNSYLKANQR